MCAYFGLGMYDESLNWGMKGLRLAKKSKDHHLIAQALANIALSYLELGYYTNSKRAFDAVRKLAMPNDESNKTALDILEARLHLVDSNLEAASKFIEQALENSLRLKYRLLIWESYRIRGVVNYRLGIMSNLIKILEMPFVSLKIVTW